VKDEDEDDDDDDDDDDDGWWMMIMIMAMIMMMWCTACGLAAEPGAPSADIIAVGMRHQVIRCASLGPSQ
jgi:hypothetical protein